MTNYVIEDNIDFFSLLNKTLNDKDEVEDTCLLSKKPLDKNQTIELLCGHKFNYVPLFKEIKWQKKYPSNTDVIKLTDVQIKCPYCRNIQNEILPFIPGIPGIKKIKGVTTPESYGMKSRTCEYVFKGGKRKGTLCGKNCLGKFCFIHNKTTTKIAKAAINVKNVDYSFNSLNNYNVLQLKGLCKELKLKGYSKFKKKPLIEFIIEKSK